jgi:hypothetical protein
MEAWQAAPNTLLVVARGNGGTGRTMFVAVTTNTITTTDLPDIGAGYRADVGQYGMDVIPGLAFDPTRHTAFVIPADGPVAEIAIDEGSVTYHVLDRSIVNTVAAALVPSASAKMSGWIERQAVWLGDGLIAVTGTAADVAGADAEAFGIRLLDTATWRTCVLDEAATNVAFSNGILVGWGGVGGGEHGGVGLVAFDLRRGTSWHLFGDQYLDAQVSGPYAYAVNSWHGWHATTVALSGGRALSRLDHRPPTVLRSGSATASA